VYAALCRRVSALRQGRVQGTAGGLFKSTDDGTTWKRLTSGLPANLSQITLRSHRARRCRCIHGGHRRTGDYSSAAGLGVFSLRRCGESWIRITSDPRPALRIGGGDLPRYASILDPDVVYTAGIVTRSPAMRQRLLSLRGAPGGDDYQTCDQPNDPRINRPGRRPGRDHNREWRQT